MPRKQLEVPPVVARTFVKHMRAFYAERSAIERDNIAGDAAHLLKPYLPPRDRKLRLPLAPARAVVVEYSLSLRPTDGSGISGTGTLTLDRAINPTGADHVAHSDVTGLTFNIDGHTFGIGIPIFTLTSVDFLNGALADIVASSVLSAAFTISLSTTAT